MTLAQRQLGRRIEAILRREIGLRDAELAEKLGVPLVDVLPVVRAMWAMRSLLGLDRRHAETESGMIAPAVVASLPDLPATTARRIIIDPASGCWVWQGPCDRYGYGRLGSRNSHRVVCELLEGPVPEGLVLDHREDWGCATKACCFPGHLLPVTNYVNCMRAGTGVGAVNLAKQECDSGHPFNASNTYWRPNGHRDCRKCVAKRQRDYQARLKARASGLAAVDPEYEYPDDGTLFMVRAVA